jgi:hypothetical protein
MRSALATYPLPFDFNHLAPTAKVQFHGESRFTYSLSEPLRVIRNDRGAALHRFVNSDASHETIMQFIAEFGPLRHGAYSHSRGLRSFGHLDAKASREFTELVYFEERDLGLSFVSIWEETQLRFRRLWSSNKALAAFQFDEEWGGRLAYERGHLTYTTRNFEGFLFLSFVANRPRMRKCENEDCPTPYFFTHHGPQRYCDDACAHEAEKRSKREWWNANKVARKAGKRGKK